MADGNDHLLLSQLVSGDWTVAIVGSEAQAQRRARNMQEDALVKQCAAVPISLAALAPKLADMLRGHNDPHIDALLAGAAAGEAVATTPTECQQCGLHPSDGDELIQCDSCRQYICNDCDSGKSGECTLCKECAESLAVSEEALKADLEASGEADT